MEEFKAFEYFLSEMLDNGVPLQKIFYILWSIRVKYLLGFQGFVEMNIALLGKVIHNALNGSYRKIFSKNIVKKVI